jgi:hypothetical protein
MCFITLLKGVNLVSETEQIFLFQSARVLVASVIRTLLRRLKFTQIQKWDLNERLIIVICRHIRLCLIYVPLLIRLIDEIIYVIYNAYKGPNLEINIHCILQYNLVKPPPSVQPDFGVITSLAINWVRTENRKSTVWF